MTRAVGKWPTVVLRLGRILRKAGFEGEMMALLYLDLLLRRCADCQVHKESK